MSFYGTNETSLHIFLLCPYKKTSIFSSQWREITKTNNLRSMQYTSILFVSLKKSILFAS